MDVFISYSHRDRAWKDRVATFMRVMKVHQPDFDYTTWDDGEIEAGDTWSDVIDRALEQARVAILLISPDFLCSTFIREREVPKLLERRERGELDIVPVIVRPCPWEVVEWLAPIQLHPPGGDALSGGSDHAIEQHLKGLALEVDRLVDQSRRAIEAEVEGEMEGELEVEGARGGSRGAEEAVQTSIRGVSRKGGFEFLADEGVKEQIAAHAGEAALDALLLFQTSRQRTWLVTTPGQLHCVLDSEETRTADRLFQWDMQLDPWIRVHARPRADSSRSGLVDIGKRQNWLYSLRLHPEPEQLVETITQMIQAAIVD